MEERGMKAKPSLVDFKVDTKLVLAAAWIAMMFLYIYCDYFSLYKPGQLGGISAGDMGFMKVTQASLFAASGLMVIPSLMILVSACAAARANRVINMIASVLYFLVNVGNLIGETWGYYYLFGLLELGLVAFIFVVSLRWPRRGE